MFNRAYIIYLFYHNLSSLLRLLIIPIISLLRWLSNDWAVPPYPITSSPDATVDPPPPYSEIDNEPGATVKPALAADNSFVKKKETGTLTEPSDYAMAYKAMQHNHQLPEGKRAVSSIDQLSADLVLPPPPPS